MIILNIHDYFHGDLNKDFGKPHTEEELRKMYGDRVDVLWEQGKKDENKLIEDAWKNNHNLYRVFVTKGNYLGIYILEGDNNKEVREQLFTRRISEKDIVDVKTYQVRKGQTFIFISR